MLESTERRIREGREGVARRIKPVFLSSSATFGDASPSHKKKQKKAQALPVPLQPKHIQPNPTQSDK